MCRTSFFLLRVPVLSAQFVAALLGVVALVVLFAVVPPVVPPVVVDPFALF